MVEELTEENVKRLAGTLRRWVVADTTSKEPVGEEVILKSAKHVMGRPFMEEGEWTEEGWNHAYDQILACYKEQKRVKHISQVSSKTAKAIGEELLIERDGLINGYNQRLVVSARFLTENGWGHLEYVSSYGVESTLWKCEKGGMLVVQVTNGLVAHISI